MTKAKVFQIGFIIALLGFFLYKFVPVIVPNEISTGSISNVILFSIIFVWVTSYLLRVVNGKMTFMEQRKRYRKEYDKIMDDKLNKKFNSMTLEEQNVILEELDEN